MADEKSVDVYNGSVLLASELAFRQIRQVESMLPNPPGFLPQGAQGRLTNEELERLTRGR